MCVVPFQELCERFTAQPESNLYGVLSTILIISFPSAFPLHQPQPCPELKQVRSLRKHPNLGVLPLKPPRFRFRFT